MLLTILFLVLSSTRKENQEKSIAKRSKLTNKRRKIRFEIEKILFIIENYLRIGYIYNDNTDLIFHLNNRKLLFDPFIDLRSIIFPD